MFFTVQLSTRFSQYGRAFLYGARRYRTSPEMPLVGSQEWRSMLASLRAQQEQLPLKKRYLSFQSFKLKDSHVGAPEFPIPGTKAYEESIERLQDPRFLEASSGKKSEEADFPVGSAPKQLPVPGEPGWDLFVRNVERFQKQPPITLDRIEITNLLNQVKQVLEKQNEMLATLKKIDQKVDALIRQLGEKEKVND